MLSDDPEASAAHEKPSSSPSSPGDWVRGVGGWGEKPPLGGTTHLMSSCFQRGPSGSQATALVGPAAARVGLSTGLAWGCPGLHPG